jgi:hypothetical protein
MKLYREDGSETEKLEEKRREMKKNLKRNHTKEVFLAKGDGNLTRRIPVHFEMRSNETNKKSESGAP